MTSSIKSIQPKMAKAGKLEIAINHFTTDITSLPYWMDSNCYIVFSLLWRRYISASINERLITPDGWYQYTMKSLMEHSGFKDKGTLHRTVEGLYRSGLVDVRVEDGSRMWACWKMNKKNIEYVASIADRDAMQEPYINSINTIGSKDKNFTYQLNKEGITELMKFFMVSTVENPPLFNTIPQEHCNTTLPYNHTTTSQNDYSTSQLQDYMGKTSSDSELEREFEEPLEDSSEGGAEQKSKDEIDAKERPSQFQYSEGKNAQQQEDIDSSTERTQLTEQEEFDQWKKLVAPELEKMKHATSRADFHQMKKKFFQFLYEKVVELGVLNEGVKKLMESYLEDFMSTWEYNTIARTT